MLPVPLLRDLPGSAAGLKPHGWLVPTHARIGERKLRSLAAVSHEREPSVQGSFQDDALLSLVLFLGLAKTCHLRLV